MPYETGEEMPAQVYLLAYHLDTVAAYWNADPAQDCTILPKVLLLDTCRRVQSLSACIL
jgi:hypothetical protein